jgi:hypothetical protein
MCRPRLSIDVPWDGAPGLTGASPLSEVVAVVNPDGDAVREIIADRFASAFDACDRAITAKLPAPIRTNSIADLIQGFFDLLDFSLPLTVFIALLPFF